MTPIDHYVAAGWHLVAIPPRAKRPIGDDWPHRKYSRAELAAGNVGVLLGVAPANLADVDLDCGEAIALADAVLPATLAFGRPSKPRSHRWLASPGVRTRQFRAPGGGMLVELRGLTESGEPGAQTVIPPSIHESGEPITWDEDDGRDGVELADAPLAMDAGELLERVTRLAVAALIMRHAGEAAARRVLDGGAWPRLPRPILARAREWLGVPDERSARRAPAPATVTDEDAERRAAAYLAHVPPAVSGQGGHAHTFLVAQHVTLGFWLDDDTAYRVLTVWNASNAPPWSERELRRKIREARQRGKTVSVGAHLEARS